MSRQPTNPWNEAEERDLFRRIAHGDADAFARVFHHFNKRIYPFVLNMIKSELLAEEIVQDIFTQLWVKREEAMHWEYPQAYLFKMATNRTLDQLRKISRETHLIQALTETMHNTPLNDIEAWLDGKETSQLIHEAVSTLPPQRLKVYRLCREQGLSYRETAEQLGISVKTVQAHLQEATRQIRAYISSRPGGALMLLLLGYLGD